MRMILRVVIAIAALVPGTQAATEAVLTSFQGPTKGSTPYASVIGDRSGNLFGNTYWDRERELSYLLRSRL